MGNRDKVVKFKKRKNMNIGIIIFLIMFLYLSIKVYIYFTNDQITIYEVHEGETTPDKAITGLILREEKVVNSDKAGYITYFQKEGAKIAKKSRVYAVNEDEQIAETIANNKDSIALSDENYAQMSYDILSFQKSYTDKNFISVYDFKENAQSMVLDLMNTAMLEQAQTIQKETGLKYSYDMYKSKDSGIITYYIDSFEKVAQDNITKDLFENRDYQRKGLRAMEMVSKDSPVYKLVTSNEWSIILPLTPEQYAKAEGKERISFKILKDDLETSAPLSLFQEGADCYAKLTMNSYLPNYLHDRFLEINLEFNTAKGLKIPKTSVIKKDFYQVPIKFLTGAGDGNNKSSLMKKVYSKKTGEPVYENVDVNIYYMDDTYAYVNSNILPVGTEISSAADGDSQSYRLTKLDKLTGVYSVNTGYALFRRVEILSDENEYYIIKSDTPYGMSAYDHIALDSDTILDQAIIY